MKFAILITTLLSILAASPAFAQIWQTRAALFKFFRSLPRDVVRQKILDASTPLKGEFTWRSEDQIPITQWLARWVGPDFIDDEDPSPGKIFTTGFYPKVNPDEAFQDDKLVGALDIQTYVTSNTDSVYVATTRYVRDDGYIWTPRNRANAFRYDLFAPGGIDINPTLGPHKYENQHEIAFIGGIQPSFVYGALELTSEKTQKCYHINPNYVGDPPEDYPRRYRRIPYCFYNKDGSFSHKVDPKDWQRLQKRSATMSNETKRTVESMTYSESTSSYCYKVIVQSISIDQPNELSAIKTYGKINVFIQKPSSATVWDESKDTAQVMKKIPVSGKKVLLKADVSRNPHICFEGSIYKYDQDFTDGDKQISQFTSGSCVKTQSSTPSKRYSLTSSSEDGSVEIQFKVARCGN